MSASTPSNTSTFSFRSKPFWLIVLFVIYSIFGWFIVPSIVDTQLKENLKSLANWDTQVDKIVFNPYRLSLKVSGANIQSENKQNIISFDHLFINFSLIETLGGTISFDEISLDKPTIQLDIDQNGITNFQHAFTSENTEAPLENEEDEGSEGIIGLFFDQIAISSGTIRLSDDSQGENFKLTVAPLSLSLEGFSTRNNEGGDYALSISLGDDQQIDWHGQIGMAPFKSQGRLALKNINSDSFWHYAKSASPYWLKQARISISGDYETAIHEGTTQLSINNAALAINDAILSETANKASLFAFTSLNVAPISFDLAELSLDLGSIELVQPNISIERAQDASLNILRPFTTQDHSTSKQVADTAPESTDETKSDDKPFRWNISDITISEGQINWTDETLATPAKLGINNMTLNLGQMSDMLSEPFPYALSFIFQDTQIPSQQHVIEGNVSLLPFAIKGTTKIHNIDLNMLQNYLADVANVTLTKGQLSLESAYELAILETDSQSQLTGEIISSLRLDDLAIADNNLNKPLSGFKQLAVGPAKLAFSDGKTNINIESIRLDAPYGDILVAENGQMNLSQLLNNTDKQAVAENEKTESVSGSDTQTSSNDQLSMLLSLFEIKKGQFTYTDASLSPSFTTRISDLNGSIENISTDNDNKSKVAFTGKIDSQGKLDIKGTLNPLSETPNTDIKILASNIDLTTASPYSAKFAGYQIDKGKLDLDLSYLINDTKLNAKNHILLNQFEFGKSVKSPDATSLPLPLAIGILKDRNGKIDINLPISGDLDDPSFKISSVILNTFVNLLTKVVTSPFSILGGLIEGADDISDIQFVANSDELTLEQTEKVLSLSKALKQRPNLTLEIRGVADANIDQQENIVATEAELIQLAKRRALAMYEAVIEEGDIDKSRVFVLEPNIIALSEPEVSPNQDTEERLPTISSKFTLGVR